MPSILTSAVENLQQTFNSWLWRCHESMLKVFVAKKKTFSEYVVTYVFA